MPRGREQRAGRNEADKRRLGTVRVKSVVATRKGCRELIHGSVKGADLTPCAHKLRCLQHIPRPSGVNSPRRKAGGC